MPAQKSRISPKSYNYKVLPDPCSPTKVRAALLNLGSKGWKTESSPLQDSMVEWYLEQPEGTQEYISELCSEIINSITAKREGSHGVWFGPVAALQLLGVLICAEFRWKRFK